MLKTHQYYLGVKHATAKEKTTKIIEVIKIFFIIYPPMFLHLMLLLLAGHRITEFSFILKMAVSKFY